MNDQPKQGGPCAGLRVIELGSLFSAPIAGQILGDMGAEVIKIEPPGGDPLRKVGPFHNEMGALFMMVNRRKKSVILDLKSPDDLNIAKQLIATADVLIHNNRAGVMERLGLGYDQLKDTNTKLVYAAISGFGTSGPYASNAAYDHLLQGMTGIMYVQGRGGNPEPIRNLIVDKTAATITASAILGALLQRERGGGLGQRVDASLLNTFSWIGMMDNINTFESSEGGKTATLDIHHPVRTRDGWVIGHVQSDEHFSAACRIFEREDLIGHDDWNSVAQRVERSGDMWREFSRRASEMTRNEVLARAAEKGIAIGPIYTLEEFLQDSQVKHNHAYVDFEDPDFGTVRYMNFPVSFSAASIDIRSRAPLLGEHTEEVLTLARS
ncbi:MULTISPECIES: CaiB/BaiF CoA transferase family protein [Caballeronia]|uniref:Carnitine dehydratase n=1 Tax=Caballeronia zhejiangensis TaxID=871203 RepID=A0A656QES9_9BURK|nr:MULTISPECIES: CoA transferase [Caballeronia]EKS71821.1 acyl-CoA transferase/carnitine dehydratase [Burkholderia sp. SJ98]KDR25329.1 carnitine dehydratase [Caballeronia zhejiangensis]